MFSIPAFCLKTPGQWSGNGSLYLQSIWYMTHWIPLTKLWHSFYTTVEAFSVISITVIWGLCCAFVTALFGYGLHHYFAVHLFTGPSIMFFECQNNSNNDHFFLWHFLDFLSLIVFNCCLWCHPSTLLSFPWCCLPSVSIPTQRKFPSTCTCWNMFWNMLSYLGLKWHSLLVAKIQPSQV